MIGAVTKRAVAVAAAASVLSLVMPAVALAEEPASLTLPAALDPVPVGSEINIPAGLTTLTGQPLEGMQLRLFVDGEYIRSVRTDASGRASLRVQKAETAVAGERSLVVRFEGRGTYLPVESAPLILTVTPATVHVRTVPAVAGVQVDLEDPDGAIQQATTGRDGTVAFEVLRVGTYQLTPLLDLGPEAPSRIGFLRWEDGEFFLSREIEVPDDQDLVLGVRVAYRGSVRFVDPAGNTVDARQITSATFTGERGERLTLSDFDEAWWDAATAVMRATLEPEPIVWKVDEVEMAGSNVVNRGQEQWTPTPGGTWTIQLLLYDLDIATEDALFGSPVGGSLELVYPDGTMHETQLTSDGMAHYAGLPRGEYTARLRASGLVAPTPIALSRSQTTAIRVITYVDIAVVGTILAAIAAALVLVGRGRRRRPARRPRASVDGAYVRQAPLLGTNRIGAVLSQLRRDVVVVLAQSGTSPAPDGRETAMPAAGSRTEALGGTSIYTFSVLLTLGDTGAAARFAATALRGLDAGGDGEFRDVSAEVWLRRTVLWLALSDRASAEWRPTGTETTVDRTADRLAAAGVTSDIAHALRSLSLRERAALIAADVEGYSEADVAEILEASGDTAGRVLADARTTFARAYAAATADPRRERSADRPAKALGRRGETRRPMEAPRR
ncbi:MAG: hypothetical protein M3295_05010 [Chloroflexota bacterium]|nr:hypothetical protein [Chloroflexota bacterium]